MTSAEVFDNALITIAQGDSSIDRADAPERYLHAAKDLYDFDPGLAENVLLERAKKSGLDERIKYLHALTYFGMLKGNFLDETFQFLVDLCEGPAPDAASQEAAVSALYWSDFPNIHAKNFNLVYDCLERMTSIQPPVLSARTINNARVRLEEMKEHKTAEIDLLAGRVVVPDSITRSLLSYEGAESLAGLGLGSANVEALVRSIAWSSTWVRWQHLRKRRSWTDDLYEVGTELVAPMGEPRLPLTVIWRVDRKTKIKTASACYLGNPGSRPDLLRM